jgi:lipopolysaccharide/colanic/teichoic acid biosynthesis glycosyltransferase
MKRIFDILASFFGLIFLFPFLLVIALLIRVNMPGPVIFRQQRAGRYGTPFTIYKFRSMTLDHEGGTVSVKGDKRITPLGAKLRRYKLDELPELWNVFIGDMSFVGPRPDMPEYVDRLQGEERLILNLRPGITGPASLKYAREEELLALKEDPQKYNDEVLWPDKVKLNLDYYYNWSFIKDIKIIFFTIFGSEHE